MKNGSKIEFLNQEFLTCVPQRIYEGMQHHLNISTLDNTGENIATSLSLQQLTFLKDTASGGTLPSLLSQRQTATHPERGIRVSNEEENKVYEVKMKSFAGSGNDFRTIAVMADQTVFEELLKRKILNTHQKMLLASISHEIKNPLHSIEALSSDLARDITPESRTRISERIRNAARSIFYIISGACDLMLEDINPVINSKFKPTEAIAEIIDLFQPTIEAKQLTYELRIHGVLPDSIATDEKRYKLILFNLIANAAKYTNKGSIKIVVQFKEEENMLETEISDTGSGIKPESLPNLGKLYANIEQANVFNPQGMGLGMALIHKLVEMLGGKIIIHSKVGEGTTIAFTIGLQPNPSEEIKKVKEIHYRNDIQSIFVAPTSDTREKCCTCSQALVVDDEPINREVIKNYLRSIHIDSDEAENGSVAIDKVFEREGKSCCGAYKLIVMDINMPVMDGTEATKILTTIFQEKKHLFAPIIAVTAMNLNSLENYTKMIDLGFKEVRKHYILTFLVEKPVRKATFLDKVNSILKVIQ